MPWGACDIATNVLGSPEKGNMLGTFAWKKGRGSWCHGVPAILLPTFGGTLGRGTCLEYLLGKRDGGVGATGCLRYCYQRFGEPLEGERAWNICLQQGTGESVPRDACDIATNVSRSRGKGNVLGIFAWKRGRGSWCHGVPAILLPTFRGAVGRGTCLEYLLGKRDEGVGATECLRYCHQRFGQPWAGERAWNICLEKGTGELVPRSAYDITTNLREPWEGERAWNICLEKGTGELVPRSACDIATNVSGSRWKGNVLGIFACNKGRGSRCHGMPATLLPTFHGAGGRGTCLEYVLGKGDGGVGATGCLRYCYQHFGEPWEGERAWNICLEKGTGELVPRSACDISTNVSGSRGQGNLLGMFASKKGRGSWCHRVPAILLPTFRAALGRGTCLEYLLGKRSGGVGATECLRYYYQLFREPWEGERAWNICLEKGTGELVPRSACAIATNVLGSPGKGKMLGTLSRRSRLLHMLCQRRQKAKNAVENPLQNATSEMEHFGQQKNISR